MGREEGAGTVADGFRGLSMNVAARVAARRILMRAAAWRTIGRRRSDVLSLHQSCSSLLEHIHSY